MTIALNRMRACRTPAVPPVDFDPSATYNKGDLVKIGGYIEVPTMTSETSKKLWLFYGYDVTKPSTSWGFGALSGDVLELVTSDTRRFISLASATRTKNTAALIAALVATEDSTIKVVGNPAWGAQPPTSGQIDTGQPTSAFTAARKVYRCKIKVGSGANISVFPVEDSSYWQELTGYSPEAADAGRAHCPNTQNHRGAEFCGRCGNPLDA